MNNLIEEKAIEILNLVPQIACGNASIEKLKTSLNEVVEVIKKEYEEKYNNYRNGILDELDELGYNKDAIKKREKEILEGIKINLKDVQGGFIIIEEIDQIINKK